MSWSSAALAQPLAAQSRNFLTIEVHRALGRPLEGHHEAADRRLAAARLAHQPECLALAHRKRDVGHCLDRADHPLHDGAGGDGELLFQVVKLQQDRSFGQRPRLGLVRDDGVDGDRGVPAGLAAGASSNCTSPASSSGTALSDNGKVRAGSAARALLLPPSWNDRRSERVALTGWKQA